MGVLLYPEGSSPDPQFTLAPRGHTTLSGTTLGLLINGKRNSDHLLLDIADLLGQRFRLSGVVSRTKPSHGRTAPAKMLDELSGACDVMVTAIGD
jgi:hypothetical protein